MRTDTKTKVRYATGKVDEEGNAKFSITSEEAWNKMLKGIQASNTEAEKAGTALAPIPDSRTGTFGYQFPTTVDEAVTLAGGTGVGEFTNIDVFLGVFNYAASLRQDNEANDILASDNFEPWEGVKDVSYAVAQKVERAKMTVEEKTISLLAKSGIKITPDDLRAFLEERKQAAATA